MYTTPQQVYSLIGVGETAISEPIIEDYIKQAEAEVERIIKTTCKPEIVVEKFNGYNENTYCLRRTPLLNVFEVKINDTSVSTKYIDIKETGEIYLSDSAEVKYWSLKENSCKIVYLFGRLEQDKDVAQEVLTVDLDDGLNVEITVTDFKDYPVGDYVKIEGIDGNYEVTKILESELDTGVSKITVNLYQPHDSGSILTKMKVPQIIQNLTAVLAAIKGSSFMIGNTYTFATSYSMPDYSVTKGVPYPHFNRNLEQTIAQRDYLISKLAAEAVFA